MAYFQRKLAEAEDCDLYFFYLRNKRDSYLLRVDS